MIVSTHLNKLISFLQDDLAISQPSMEIALKQVEHNHGPLPMILWQYGFVTIDQLDRIYEWLEGA